MSVNSVLNFNKGYNDSYIILPLKKEYNGLKVSTTSDTNASNIDKDILNELLAADRDKNNCLTLNEINNVSDKNEFFKRLQQAMQNFASNPNRDYSANIFEIIL